MAARRRKPILPLSPRPKRIPSSRPIEHLLRQDSFLAEARREAAKRFAKLPGVCGIGIGRPFSEEKGSYRGEGFAIKVSVLEKRRGAEIPPEEQIPKTLLVKDSETGARRRICIDVVEVGEIRQTDAETRPFPSSGALRAGRLFAFKVPPPTPGALLPDPVEVGTVGAILRAKGGQVVVVSAGHVFADTCRGVFEAPDAPTALGCNGRTWVEVPAGSYSPITIRPGIHVEDCLALLPPGALTATSQYGWPPGFKGEVVENNDVTRALSSDAECGFVWVERGPGVPTPIAIDLESHEQSFSASLRCGATLRSMRYGFVWRCRFTTQSTTTGGDSGSPVFLTTESGPRLLGFHFFESEQKNASYSCDARLFFRRHVGEPGKDFVLPLDS
ncbi:MAG: hypothetical protein ABL886_04425 [Rhodoglobus sp.]